MEKEEQYIYNRFGKQNPFTVPEGYFDSLHANLMQHTTTSQKKTLFKKRWLGYVAAACLVGVIAGLVTSWSFKTTEVGDKHVAVARDAAVVDDISEEEYVDYTMLDNDDIYSFLANN